MNRFQNKITLNICEMVFLKDPNSSELGRNILKGSIDLIDELVNIINNDDVVDYIYDYFENKI